MSHKRISNTALISSVTALVLLAQQPPQPGANTGGEVIFRSQTELVVETVAVRDRNGKTVEGLTAKDFTVTEDGVVQHIEFCDFEKLPETPAAPMLPKPPAASQGRPAAENRITPEVAGDDRYANRRLIALYFDMSAMAPPDQLRSFDAALKFIRTRMTAADMISIMKYANGAVKVLSDFTGDRDELQKTIGTLVAGEGAGFDESVADDSSADTGAAFGQDDSEFNIFNTDRQLAAVQTAVRMLGGLHGRKSFVYFAGGMRLNGINNQAQMQATVNAAVRANVVMFPVDARGLVASAPLGDATVGSSGGAGMYSASSASAAAASFERSQDTLFTLASDTGGKALLDSNDLTLGIVRAQEAISSYYVIGYRSGKPELDGKFRRIGVAWSGDTSAKLEYRQGYFAGKTFGRFTSSDKERQLEEALMLGDPITDLPLAMEIDYFQINRAQYYVPVAMKIPGSELALARRGGAGHTVIDFIGEVKDEYGGTVTNIRDKVDMKLTDATAAELSKRPILYDTGFTLLPGIYTVKVLARDDETGRIGTYMQKFVIPNLNNERTRIPISSVVIGSQRAEFKDALFNAAKDKGKSEMLSPLVQDGSKLLPSVNRVFSRGRDIYIYLQAYGQTATAAQPLVAFVTFYSGHAKAFETTPIRIAEATPDKLKTMPVKFSIPLDKLHAGRYTCQVTLLDPAGQKGAFWQAPIQLTD